jgi:hypothetical protein
VCGSGALSNNAHEQASWGEVSNNTIVGLQVDFMAYLANKIIGGDKIPGESMDVLFLLLPSLFASLWHPLKYSTET